MPDKRGTVPTLRRRALLRSTGVAGIGMLAGCTSALTGGSTSTSTESSSTPTPTDVSTPAGPPEPTALLYADDAAESEAFGSAVAIDGDRALVGARDDAFEGEEGAGAAYIFEKQNGTWTQSAKLTQPIRDTRASFGFAVGLAEEVAVVSAPRSGAVFVFERTGDGWEQTAILERDAPLFVGLELAFDGETLVATAEEMGNSRGGPNGVFVFERRDSGWHEAGRFTGAPQGKDAYGHRVALAGNTALVGAPGKTTDAGEKAGSVAVLEKGGDGWTHAMTLTHPDAAADQFFGRQLAITAGRAAVGIPGIEHDDRDFPGAVAVFDRTADGFQHAATVAPERHRGPFPNWAVALEEDRLLARADSPLNVPFEYEAVYVYEREADGWAEAAIIGPNASSGKKYGWQFGQTIDLDRTSALIGAPGADGDTDASTGAAYIYTDFS